jgi:pyruvate decarboxylase
VTDQRISNGKADPVVESNIGTYLARRLIDLGIEDYFVVPGDYNLLLLDQILKFPEMRLISCCNELNAGYAADGYARARGVSVVFVTFMVGGLSVINAVAGAYSDDLPVIVVSGGPNSNDYGTNRILHHTIGLAEKRQPVKMFEQVTAAAVEIQHMADAPAKIDHCLSTAVRMRKPVYLEISCNIATEPVPMPGSRFSEFLQTSNQENLKRAVRTVSDRFNGAVKPVLVAGAKIRQSGAEEAFRKLADSTGCAVAVMPNAKGMFPEDHPGFIGTYWGNISSPFCCETVESSDLYIFVGPVFNDYTTAGYSTLIQRGKMIEVTPERIKLPMREFGCVHMKDFLLALSEQVEKKEASLEIYRRLYEPPGVLPAGPGDEPLKMKVLKNRIEGLLTEQTALLVETGDSWFNGQKMKLPGGCGYEFQMQYGSIGWSVGAVLGYALALQKKKKRVIAMIGDGSFQLTAQEVSTMIRYGLDPIIFLINNRGYTIEVEIHDGIYNNIKNWDYAGLMDVFNAGEGNGWGRRVGTEEELVDAISFARDHRGVALIECVIDRDDCSKELLEWGSRVAAANGRPQKVAEEF